MTPRLPSLMRYAALVLGLHAGAVPATGFGFSGADSERLFGDEVTRAAVAPDPVVLLLIDDSSGTASVLPPGSGPTQLQQFREAALALLDELPEARFGLMRFTDPGGAVALPVAPLDALASAAASTHGEQLRQRIAALTPGGNAPLVGTLLEAAHYLRGLSVEHGRSLGHVGDGRAELSHPSSYEHGAPLPEGCGVPGAAACEAVAGAPRYLSPLLPANSEPGCFPQASLVLFSAGAADHNDAEGGFDHRRLLAQQFAGGTCVTTVTAPDPDLGPVLSRNLGSSTNELCARDIVHRLAEWSWRQEFARVETHVVTPDVLPTGHGQALVHDLSFNGWGSETRASDVRSIGGSLRGVRLEFDFDALGTAALSPTGDAVYLMPLSATTASPWRGNLKRYGLEPESVGVVLDRFGQRVFESETGLVAATAASFWGTGLEADGASPLQGGVVGVAAVRQPPPVYAFLGDLLPEGGSPLQRLPAAFSLLDPSEQSLLAGRLGLSLASQGELDAAYAALIGQDVGDADFDGSTTDARADLPGSIHGRPVVVRVGGSDGAPVEMIVLLGADGALRWFDAANGVELGRFVLPEHLAKHVSRALGEAVVGIGPDATPTLWLRDTGRSGIIEPGTGDFVRVVFGEREGGDHYYAVDLTPPVEIGEAFAPGQLATLEFLPRLLWVVDGGRDAPGTPGFENLGDSWSEPVLARVRGAGGVVREVFIVGGGNDPRFDRAWVDLSDSTAAGAFGAAGNAVYLIDAATGGLLTSIGGPGSSAHLHIDAMRYPIPSAVATLSSRNDGIVDRLYVGDLGGQVWRVDLAPTLSATAVADDIATVGLLARLGAAPTIAEAAVNTATGADGAHGMDSRKFYLPPALSNLGLLVGRTSQEDDTFVVIASASLGSASNEVTEDHLYVLRDRHRPRLRSDGSGVALAFPQTAQGHSTAVGPIGGDGRLPGIAASLVDVTENPFQGASNGDYLEPGSPAAQAFEALGAAQGWFIRLPQLLTSDQRRHTGEKLLASPLVVQGTYLAFNAYTPPDRAAALVSCWVDPSSGFTRSYVLDLATGAAFLNQTGWASAGYRYSPPRGEDRSSPVVLSGARSGVLLVGDPGEGMPVLLSGGLPVARPPQVGLIALPEPTQVPLPFAALLGFGLLASAIALRGSLAGMRRDGI